MPAKTALITGASGGIGLELAKLFAAAGCDLVLIARSRDRLEAAATTLRSGRTISVRTIVKDLAQASASQEVYEEVASCDFLLNNAGVATHGKFVEFDAGQTLRELQLNVVTLTHLTRHFLPGMVERGFGRVLNVASTAAFQPGPLMAVYYASKAYVLSFSEAIADELAGTGVTVTCLCPGPTATNFQERAGAGDVRIFRAGMADAAAVAKAGYDALLAGKPLVIPGIKNRILAAAVRLSPRRLVTKISRAALERT